jgi:serine/threonine-protein kinase
MLEDEEIGIILSERTLGTMDLTHLLCLLKRKHPQIVSMVVTESEDSNLICRMINQGQIYRFVPKPLKAGNLRLALKSAISKRNELLENPLLGERHQVTPLSAEEAVNFQQSMMEKAISNEDAEQVKPQPSSGRVVGFFRRLFGA